MREVPQLVPVPPRRLNIVILGLTITSSWGNGHATTYRSLVRALCRRGHEVLFLECDKPWYRDNRDLQCMSYGKIALYRDVAELRRRWWRKLHDADLVIVGSYVPDGIPTIDLVREAAGGLTAFYDIDTPITMAALETGDCEYLKPAQIAGFDLYLSFTGGPALRRIEARYGARAARALYCAVDPDQHRPVTSEPKWALGYLGTYSVDRQPVLEKLLCEPARRLPRRRFAVAGPLYPTEIDWPVNVERIEHVGPDRHAWFYGQQRFTLNVTRADMVRMGHSPSVRLFEAAACGVPIISDWWPGLDTIFTPKREILVVRDGLEVLRHLRDMAESERQELADNARRRVLTSHTAAHRAALLETYLEEALERRHKPERSARRAAVPGKDRSLAALPARLAVAHSK